MKDAITPAYFSSSVDVRNVILLMIGVNDHLHQVVESKHGHSGGDVNKDGMGDGQEFIAEGCIDRLQALLREIDACAVAHGLRIEVIVDTIPKLSNAWKGDAVSEVIIAQGLRYNEWIRTSLPSLKFSHLTLRVVDMEGTLADFVHPNAAGYEATAQLWHDAITGTSTWTQYWPNGHVKSVSLWRGQFADGLALCFDSEGKEVSRVQFTKGQMNAKPADAEKSQPSAKKADESIAKEGACCYCDRAFKITFLPQELIGGQLVRTANNDDSSAREDYLPLDLTADSTVYVCYWAEATDLPGWLKQEAWKRTNSQARVKIGNAEKAYHVFARTASQGRLTLGGNDRSHTKAISNYFVVIKPGSVDHPSPK
jgi:hypothetical protein